MRPVDTGSGRIMPAVSDATLGASTVDVITVAGRELKIARPADPEALLDLSEVAAAYELDEYMPYWATIWPVCLHVARLIFEKTWRPGSKAIELGCGLGVPGVAATMAGLDVTFSDYDETALRFAAENARLNGCATPRTLALDLRSPLAERFDLVIASDMIYEKRFIFMLISAFDAMLAEDGVALVADQNRPHAQSFCEALGEAGYEYQAQPFQVDKTTGWEASGTVYRIKRRLKA